MSICRMCGGETDRAEKEYLVLDRIIRFGVLCSACEERKVREMKQNAIATALRDAEETGILPPNAAHYLTPPKPLVDRNPKVWHDVARWDGKHNLFLHGGEGVGKSSLANFVLVRAATKRRTVAFLPSTMIERSLWREKSEPLLRRAQWAELAVVDDLTNALWTEKGLQTLREILEVRHELSRRTIVTSEHDDTETFRVLSAVCGEVFANSMLRRLHPLRKIKMTGTSYRRELSRE